MAEYTVVELPSPKSVLGEGPHWDAQTQNLYYVDIYGPSILRYSLDENKVYSASVDGENAISFILPVEGTTNEFAIGIGRRIGVVSWDGKSPKANILRIVGEVEKEDTYKTNRFNDAKVAPNGQLYGGTMRLEECGNIFEKRLGSFYKYSKEFGFHKLIDNVGISNGLAWNEITNKMYFIDSCDLNVKEFEFDSSTGTISNERVLVEIGKKGTSVPDGMTIDNKGFLYIAIWGGSKVLKINPSSGKTELEINLPCEQVTSAAFGGPNMDILFITTAATDRDGPQTQSAGKLFKITGLGAIGTTIPKVQL